MVEKSRITEAGYVISLIAGIVILSVALFGTYLAKDIIATYGAIFSFLAYFLIASNYIAGVMVVVGSLLIKHEDHSLAGSIMVLIVSLVGILTGMGIFVGPVLGIVGGVVGLREHQHLILHKRKY
ncbi:hypothetical protein ACFLZ6_01840 [Nanoarchaeota archaeon]